MEKKGKNKRKVYVLMSTYNGEEYIAEQIDSIMNQKGVEIELWIRDDGSSDNTMSVINAYLEKDERIHLTRGDNIGVKFSFLTLLKEVGEDADYYAFSDQDDVWLEHKLLRAVRKIEAEEQSWDTCPVLYYSHTRQVDENLQKLNTPNIYNKQATYDFGQILIKNCASGCTMVFSRKLKQIIATREIKGLGKVPLHDHWIYMICRAIGGTVVFDKHSYILYRQHNHNVIGARRTIWDKLKSSPLFNEGNVRYKWSVQLLGQYEQDLTDENKKLLYNIAGYKRSIGATVGLAFNTEIKPPEMSEKLILALTVLRRRF